MYSKLLLAIFFGFLFIFFLHPFDGNGDFFHHLNTGRFVLENRALPQVDTFTHTATGLPWVGYAWGSGVIFYLIFNVLGPIGITLFVAIIATTTLLLSYVLIRSLKVRQFPALVVVALTASGLSTRFPARPEIFNYLLAVLILLVDQLRKEHPKLIWFLPVIIWLWANLYGSGVIVGVALVLALVIRQLLVDKLTIKSSQRMFFFSSLITIPAALINGYGLKSVFYFFYFIPQVSVFEGEWAGIGKILTNYPVDFLISFQYQLLIYLIFLSALILALLVAGKKLFQNKFYLILSIAAFLPIFAFRQLPMAVVLASPILAVALNQIWLSKRYLLIAGFILLTAVSFGLSLKINPISLKSNVSLSQTEMVRFISGHHLSGRAFNHHNLGAYLTFYLYPQVLVFYDTRDDLFLGTPALNDLYSAYSSSSPILPLLSKYQIDLVVGDYVSDGLNYRDLFYSKDWSIVYLSDRYFVAVPAKVAQEEQLSNLNFLDPFTENGSKPGMEKEAYQYYLTQTDPQSFNNHYFLASLLLDLGSADQVVKVLEQMPIQAGIQNPLILKDRDFLLSSAYLQINDCVNAKKFLDKTERESKGIIFFDPSRSLPTPLNKGLAFYYLKCEQNKNLALDYLTRYFNQTNLSPLEKLKTEQAFNDLSH